MKTKMILLVISALMLFACSATVFAEEPAGATDAEPTTVTAVTDADEQVTDEDKTADDNDGVTVLREEVTLDNTEPDETEIVIDSSNVAIEEQKPETEIVVDYADTTTGIPNTGSSKVIGAAMFSALCCAAAVIMALKKKKG